MAVRKSRRSREGGLTTAHESSKSPRTTKPGQSHMEFAVVEGWGRLLGGGRCQLGSRVPERRGTRVSAFLCSEKGFLCGEPPTGFFICDCPATKLCDQTNDAVSLLSPAPWPRGWRTVPK